MTLLTRRECAALAAVCFSSRAAHAERVRNKQDWRKLRDHVLAGMREVMGPLPDSPPGSPEVAILEESPFPEFIRKKLTFASGDGDLVPAYLFIPRKGKGRRPAALCLHQTTAIGKAEPAGLGGKPNLHYALELAERGFVTLAPDYPGYGDYKIDAYAMGYVSATMKGIRNHRRAVDLLVSMSDVDSRRIGVIGHSLGGLLAQLVAERGLARAAVLICSAPPRGIPLFSALLVRKQLKHAPDMLFSRPLVPNAADLDALVLTHVPLAERGAIARQLIPDSGTVARELSLGVTRVDPRRVTCPVLVCGADEDRFVPVWIARRLAARYHAPLRSYAGHGHFIIWDPGWERPAADIAAWIYHAVP